MACNVQYILLKIIKPYSHKLSQPSLLHVIIIPSRRNHLIILKPHKSVFPKIVINLIWIFS